MASAYCATAAVSGGTYFASLATAEDGGNASSSVVLLLAAIFVVGAGVALLQQVLAREALFVLGTRDVDRNPSVLKRTLSRLLVTNAVLLFPLAEVLSVSGTHASLPGSTASDWTFTSIMGPAAVLGAGGAQLILALGRGSGIFATTSSESDGARFVSHLVQAAPYFLALTWFFLALRGYRYDHAAASGGYVFGPGQVYLYLALAALGCGYLCACLREYILPALGIRARPGADVEDSLQAHLEARVRAVRYLARYELPSMADKKHDELRPAELEGTKREQLFNIEKKQSLQGQDSSPRVRLVCQPLVSELVLPEEALGSSLRSSDHDVEAAVMAARVPVVCGIENLASLMSSSEGAAAVTAVSKAGSLREMTVSIVRIGSSSRGRKAEGLTAFPGDGKELEEDEGSVTAIDLLRKNFRGLNDHASTCAWLSLVPVEGSQDVDLGTTGSKTVAVRIFGLRVVVSGVGRSGGAARDEGEDRTHVDAIESGSDAERTSDDGAVVAVSQRTAEVLAFHEHPPSLGDKFRESFLAATRGTFSSLGLEEDGSNFTRTRVDAMERGELYNEETGLWTLPPRSSVDAMQTGDDADVLLDHDPIHIHDDSAGHKHQTLIDTYEQRAKANPSLNSRDFVHTGEYEQTPLHDHHYVPEDSLGHKLREQISKGFGPPAAVGVVPEKPRMDEKTMKSLYLIVVDPMQSGDDRDDWNGVRDAFHVPEDSAGQKIAEAAAAFDGQRARGSKDPMQTGDDVVDEGQDSSDSVSDHVHDPLHIVEDSAGRKVQDAIDLLHAQRNAGSKNSVGSMTSDLQELNATAPRVRTDPLECGDDETAAMTEAAEEFFAEKVFFCPAAERTNMGFAFKDNLISKIEAGKWASQVGLRVGDEISLVQTRMGAGVDTIVLREEGREYTPFLALSQTEKIARLKHKEGVGFVIARRKMKKSKDNKTSPKRKAKAKAAGKRLKREQTQEFVPDLISTPVPSPANATAGGKSEWQHVNFEGTHESVPVGHSIDKEQAKAAGKPGLSPPPTATRREHALSPILSPSQVRGKILGSGRVALRLLPLHEYEERTGLIAAAVAPGCGLVAAQQVQVGNDDISSERELNVFAAALTLLRVNGCGGEVGVRCRVLAKKAVVLFQEDVRFGDGEPERSLDVRIQLSSAELAAMAAVTECVVVLDRPHRIGNNTPDAPESSSRPFFLPSQETSHDEVEIPLFLAKRMDAADVGAGAGIKSAANNNVAKNARKVEEEDPHGIMSAYYCGGTSDAAGRASGWDLALHLFFVPLKLLLAVFVLFPLGKIPLPPVAKSVLCFLAASGLQFALLIGLFEVAQSASCLSRTLPADLVGVALVGLCLALPDVAALTLAPGAGDSRRKAAEKLDNSSPTAQEEPVARKSLLGHKSRAFAPLSYVSLQAAEGLALGVGAVWAIAVLNSSESSDVAVEVIPFQVRERLMQNSIALAMLLAFCIGFAPRKTGSAIVGSGSDNVLGDDVGRGSTAPRVPASLFGASAYLTFLLLAAWQGWGADDVDREELSVWPSILGPLFLAPAVCGLLYLLWGLLTRTSGFSSLQRDAATREQPRLKKDVEEDECNFDALSPVGRDAADATLGRIRSKTRSNAAGIMAGVLHDEPDPDATEPAAERAAYNDIADLLTWHEQRITEALKHALTKNADLCRETLSHVRLLAAHTTEEEEHAMEQLKLLFHKTTQDGVRKDSVAAGASPVVEKITRAGEVEDEEGGTISHHAAALSMAQAPEVYRSQEAARDAHDAQAEAMRAAAASMAAMEKRMQESLQNMLAKEEANEKALAKQQATIMSLAKAPEVQRADKETAAAMEAMEKRLRTRMEEMQAKAERATSTDAMETRLRKQMQEMQMLANAGTRREEKKMAAALEVMQEKLQTSLLNMQKDAKEGSRARDQKTATSMEEMMKTLRELQNVAKDTAGSTKGSEGVRAAASIEAMERRMQLLLAKDHADGEKARAAEMAEVQKSMKELRLQLAAQRRPQAEDRDDEKTVKAMAAMEERMQKHLQQLLARRESSTVGPQLPAASAAALQEKMQKGLQELLGKEAERRQAEMAQLSAQQERAAKQLAEKLERQQAERQQAAAASAENIAKRIRGSVQALLAQQEGSRVADMTKLFAQQDEKVEALAEKIQREVADKQSASAATAAEQAEQIEAHIRDSIHELVAAERAGGAAKADLSASAATSAASALAAFASAAAAKAPPDAEDSTPPAASQTAAPARPKAESSPSAKHEDLPKAAREPEPPAAPPQRPPKKLPRHRTMRSVNSFIAELAKKRKEVEAAEARGAPEQAATAEESPHKERPQTEALQGTAKARAVDVKAAAERLRKVALLIPRGLVRDRAQEITTPQKSTPTSIGARTPKSGATTPAAEERRAEIAKLSSEVSVASRTEAFRKAAALLQAKQDADAAAAAAEKRKSKGLKGSAPAEKLAVRPVREAATPAAEKAKRTPADGPAAAAMGRRSKVKKAPSVSKRPDAAKANLAPAPAPKRTSSAADSAAVPPRVAKKEAMLRGSLADLSETALLADPSDTPRLISNQFEVETIEKEPDDGEEESGDAAEDYPVSDNRVSDFGLSSFLTGSAESAESSDKVPATATADAWSLAHPAATVPRKENEVARPKKETAALEKQRAKEKQSDDDEEKAVKDMLKAMVDEEPLVKGTAAPQKKKKSVLVAATSSEASRVSEEPSDAEFPDDDVVLSVRPDGTLVENGSVADNTSRLPPPGPKAVAKTSDHSGGKAKAGVPNRVLVSDIYIDFKHPEEMTDERDTSAAASSSASAEVDEGASEDDEQGEKALLAVDLTVVAEDDFLDFDYGSRPSGSVLPRGEGSGNPEKTSMLGDDALAMLMERFTLHERESMNGRDTLPERHSSEGRTTLGESRDHRGLRESYFDEGSDQPRTESEGSLSDPDFVLQVDDMTEGMFRTDEQG